MEIRIIMFLIFFIACVYVIGCLFCYDNELSIEKIINGTLVIFSLFEIYAVPMILLDMPLSTLVSVYVVSIIFLFIIALLKNKEGKLIKIKVHVCIYENVNIWYVLSIALVLFQIYKLVFYMHIDDDDAFYIGTATTALHTNTMYQFKAETGAVMQSFPSRHVLSPLPIFIAVLSCISKIHPEILAHTVLPILWIVFSYSIYFLIGYEIFGGKHKEIGMFLVFLNIINIFGCYSIYSASTFSLIRVWQGKAMLASWIIPWFWYINIKTDKSRYSLTYIVKLCTVVIGASMVSSMGIIMSIILVGIFGLVDLPSLNEKKEIFKLIIVCFPCMILGILYLLLQRGTI